MVSMSSSKQKRRWPLKSQTVRLLDVFVFGPVMLGAAAKVPDEHKVLKAGTAAIGIGTILYNGVNYLEYEEQSTRKKRKKRKS